MKTKGELDAVFRDDGVEVGGDERDGHADKDTDGGDSQGKADGSPASVTKTGGLGGDDEACTGGFGKRTKEIGTHTSDITDVVTNVIGDGCGVAGGVLREVLNDLTSNISTHVSSLGVDTTTDTAEEGNGGATQTEAGNAVHHKSPLVDAEEHGIEAKSDVHDQDTETREGETHDGASAEGSVEAILVAVISLGIKGSAYVGVYGDFHADVTRGNRSAGAKHERESGEEAEGSVLAPGNEREDDDGEEGAKQCAIFVLSVKKRLSSG